MGGELLMSKGSLPGISRKSDSMPSKNVLWVNPPGSPKAPGWRSPLMSHRTASVSPLVPFGPQEDIFIIKTDGTGLRQLTDDYERDRHPRWSPDGKQITFYSIRSGKYEVWTINRDGSGLRQRTFTTDKPAGALCCAWSPDGTRLSYSFF